MAMQFKFLSAAAIFVSAAAVYSNSYALTAREQLINDRTQPVGAVEMQGAAPAAAGGAAGARTVASNFDRSCKLCHGTGVAGAPKVGDKAAWAPRLSEGKATLYEHALKGFKGMPPRGTCADCSDQEIKELVDYLVKQAS